MRYLLFVFILFLVNANGEIIPRQIMALYDSDIHPDVADTRIHNFAEMPLNHLGCFLKYCDVHKALPNIAEDPHVFGILVWLEGDNLLNIDEMKALINWLTENMEKGKQVVFMGYIPFLDEAMDGLDDSKVWELLGLRKFNEWNDFTDDIVIQSNDSKMTEFERKYPPYERSFQTFGSTGGQNEAFLTAIHKSNGEPAGVLGVISPQGAFVADGYAIYYEWNGLLHKEWYLNPFYFFKKAFKLKDYPAPDTTTLAGRRIYYSHIDGDGWNNPTEITEKYDRRTLSSRVIMEEVLKKYSCLPCTVGPIGADIDTDWVGTKRSDKVCREIFRLPHIEEGCHTFTHPFDWAFFYDYVPEDEVPYLHYYPGGSWLGNSFVTRVKQLFYPKPKKQVNHSYDFPRAFGLKPYSNHLEIVGAIDKVNEFSQDDKKVELYQWSGNCRPNDKQLEMVKECGVANINGGDTRFDSTYLSYSWVAPLGRWVKDLFQVYSSNSNENTYTELWRGNFGGFQLLKQTLIHTETPRRIKPINVYYHMYSGQKSASLTALKKNLDYVSAQKTAPVSTSRFARIAEGFNTTQIEKKDPQTWEVSHRGALQTVRFDGGALSAVSFENSIGVIGQKHLHGALYVYLDETVPKAVIALKKNLEFHREPPEEKYYLIDGRWRVFDVQVDGDAIEFTAQGFGACDMIWNTPKDGDYIVTISGKASRYSTKNSQLHINLEASAIKPLHVQIRRDNGADS